MACQIQRVLQTERQCSLVVTLQISLHRANGLQIAVTGSPQITRAQSPSLSPWMPQLSIQFMGADFRCGFYRLPEVGHTSVKTMACCTAAREL